MMKILVCGADGQLGLCLKDAFAETSADVTFCNRQMLDITNVDSVQEILKKIQPQIVINAAAYTAVDRAESDAQQAFAINEQGPKNLAIATELLNIPLIHISTDYVFDGTSSQAYKPCDKTSPVSVYGRSKLAGELIVQAINYKHIIIRTSWVFSEYGNNFVKTMLRLFGARESVSVVADQIGSPTYAGDLARGIIAVCEKVSHPSFNAWGTYHFSSPEQVSWYDFAVSIERCAVQQGYVLALQNLLPITTEQYPTPAKRPAFSLLDCQSFSNTFEFEMASYVTSLSAILTKLKLI